jgi:hypothetical protein
MVQVGFKTKIYCPGTIGQRCVLAALWTVKLGLSKVENQAKPLRYSAKKLYSFYQFRADVQTYSHRPRYMANSDTAETDVFGQKCQVAA